MRRNGELDEINEDALKALENATHLEEIHEDVEDSGESDDDDNKKKDKEKKKKGQAKEPVVQPAMESGFSKHDVFTCDKYPHLYLKPQEFLRIKDKGLMEIVVDQTKRTPIYCVSPTTAFPYLYPVGEKSPLDFNDAGLSRYLLRKQTLFAHRHSDGKFRWNYQEDSHHMMFVHSRTNELMVHSKVALYLTQHPEAAHQPIENVLAAFREGFNEQGLLDSHLPGLSTMMTKISGSRESWWAERMGIEAMSRDLGDPNIFLTLNMDPRADPDVRRLVYQLEFGTEMPRDHPFEMNNDVFTEKMSLYAAQISILLYRKVKIFVRAFLGDVCGVPETEPNDDWTKRDAQKNGWYWTRVEFTQTRGVAHWHLVARLGGTLETGLIGRMIQNGRVARTAIKTGNVKPGEEEAAWKLVRMGLLATRYAVLFADSLATASFYQTDDPTKPLKLDEIRKEFVDNYRNDKINLTTHPIMRRAGDPECGEDDNLDMAKVAAVSCQHQCIPTSCGGKKEKKTGKTTGCRFDFPKKMLPFTVAAIMQVSFTQTVLNCWIEWMEWKCLIILN